MAAGYDGSIRIDTSIDSKGFNTGIKAIGNSLKGLLAAVGIAFGVAAVVSFGKASVQAASDMASAWTGLKSIMDGQGKSFSDAKSFIFNNYISDGLVPATNAITAYKNLALRGYDTEQIKKTMIALKDSASFGRQGSLTMGEAVQSATEGLKNENSILVDNAGVTKNVSVMWKDYAASIGSTVDQLTKQQKILAEVSGITEETKYQTGDAAKYSQTYAGKVAMLSQSFTNLKVAVGNSIIPIISTILPFINSAINALTIFFNKVAQIMSLLFNTFADTTASVSGMEAVTSSTNDAANAQNNLADSTAASGKAAKGALASFDQLNVLQQESSSGTTGISTGSGLSTPAIDTSATDSSLDNLKTKVEKFKQDLLTFFAPLQAPFDHLKNSIKELGGNIWDGLKWAWENILKPFGIWLVQQVSPVFINILADAIDILNDVIDALKPLGQWLWDNFLQPIAKWTGGVIVDVLTGLESTLRKIGDWINNNQDSVRAFAEVIGVFATAWGLVNLAIGIWNAIGVIATVVTTAFGAAVTFLTSPIVLVTIAIAAIIAIIIILIKYWPEISAAAQKAWNWIVGVWNKAADWFRQNVTEPLKSGFDSALKWISDAWTTVWTGISDFLKGQVNNIIFLVNGMVSGIVSAINIVIGALNKIQIHFKGNDKLGIAAFDFGVSIPKIQYTPIPYLATGAVIPANAPFAAILGDQKHGTNIEAPADLIRKIVREETQNMGSQGITVNFTGTMAALIQAMKPEIDRENKRIGGSLIVGA